MKIQFGLGSIDKEYGIVYGSVEILMPRYFLEKNYGDGCNCIAYQLLCVRNDEIKVPPINYIKKRKQINCFIKLNYKIVHSIIKKKLFMEYVKNVFLNESQTFEDLHIKDFNVDSYVKDLKLFFSDYNSQFKDQDEIETLDWL
ncbi:MAG: hypothetical protein ACTHJ0_16350 [Flavipsychrobacter sp.]